MRDHAHDGGIANFLCRSIKAHKLQGATEPKIYTGVNYHGEVFCKNSQSGIMDVENAIFTTNMFIGDSLHHTLQS